MTELTAEQFKDIVKRLHYHRRDPNGIKEHITQSPIFIVQKKVKDYGYDQDYANHYDIVGGSTGGSWDNLDDWYDNLDESDQETLDQACLDSTDSSFADTSERDQFEAVEHVFGADHFRKVYYQERWENLNTHLTMEAAEAFIRRKKHDYPEGLRVYVDSVYWCLEFDAVINAMIDGTLLHVDQTRTEDWQPIETAPRDGVILVYSPDFIRVVDAQFVELCTDATHWRRIRGPEVE